MTYTERKVGDKIKIEDSHVEIMAYAKGYFMCRWKGCAPFVQYAKDFEKFLEESRQYRKTLMP